MAYVAPWLEALPAPLPGNLGKGVMRFDQLEEMKVSMNRGYPKNGWWMENPIEMDDLGVPWFWETPMFQWDDLDLGLELRTTGMKQGQQHHSGVQTKIGQQERLQRTSFLFAHNFGLNINDLSQLVSPLLNSSAPKFEIHVGFQADRGRVGLTRYVRKALGQGNYTTLYLWMIHIHCHSLSFIVVVIYCHSL